MKLKSVIVCKVLLFLTFLGAGESADPLTELQLKEVCKSHQYTDYDVVPHPNDKYQYILCSEGFYQSVYCDKETVHNSCFDPNSKTCSENACDVEELDYLEDIVKAKCTDENFLQKFPAEECQNYYLCLGPEEVRRLKCPVGLHYSEVHEMCTVPVEAQCQNIRLWCRSQANFTTFSSGNCYEYYECFNGETLTKECAYNQYYNESLKKCVEGKCSHDGDATAPIRKPDCSKTSPGEFLQHEKCYKYYVCINNIPYEMQCPSNTYYDTRARTCIKDINQVCNDV